jgi:ABC-2 type transport system ATP-binding protein
VITGLESPRIGELASGGGIVLHELTPQLASLEEAFMELTADSVEFGPTGAESAETAPAAANHVPSGEGSPR